ncbi:fibronectin type III domain-containing protein [Xanthocytophaga agilis]|uniref:Fibronectin type III domain-containing protein n=1 Tax=Xanthocytophaga agilis TaxID=3048010 RepID=A0AAE3R1V5_9BACT|nr:fibronectin type III domain-containing protein [Xanthocytophaga agilis]MDJ1499915.1 fibronectin type III domain-containing protein [Xanthocytophaga agilis]
MQKCYPIYHCILFVSFLLWFSQKGSAQSTSYGIKVLANPQKSQVTLRWAPTDPIVWQLGNKYGYTIERFTLSVKGKVEEQLAGKGKMLTTTPIKPLPREQWEQLIQKEEKAEAVHELLYGDQFSSVDPTSPSAILKKSREIENRFGMALFICDLSPQVAIAAGLMWVDQKVLPGTRYVYRIRLAQQPPNLTVEPGVIIVNPEEPPKLPIPIQVRTEFKDKSVTLSWPVFLHQGIYTAYFIEKSTDGKTFKSVTDLPYVSTSESANPEEAFFVDSLSDNQQTFYYRIKGITPFGEIGPTSEVVSGKGKEDLAGMAIIENAKITQNQSVTITWSFPAEKQNQIQGFFLSRSSKPEGSYVDVNKKILLPNQTSYTDKPTSNNNYYRLRVIGKDGKELTQSFPFLVQLEDTIPPQIPTGLTGTIDSLGVVKLSWNASKDADLQGYRLFRANSLHEDFIERTQYILKKPVFTDTINLQTLTQNIYYHIVAVDKNFNPSLASKPLCLKRPDIVPPAPPVFTQASLKSDSVWLQWQPSISDDVVTHELFCQLKTDTVINQKHTTYWKSQKRLVVPGHIFYADKGLLLGQTYRYVIQASDSAGNTAMAISPEIWYETGVRPAPANIKGVADRTKKRIQLAWKYPATNYAITKCIIYRSTEGAPFQIYQTLQGNPELFEDTLLTVNTQYQYKIKLFFQKGIQSQLSDPVKVVY